MNNYDVVVIGSGPGGYVAAIRCAQLGAKVALIDKSDNPGGTCLNRGCIPTKSLVASAKLYSELKSAESFGIQSSGAAIDFAKIMARKNNVVSQLRRGLSGLFKSNKIEYIVGTAKFKSDKEIEITTADNQKNSVTANKIIIATGSSSVNKLSFIEVDKKQIISSDEALELDKLPASMLIIGGGYIGVEFAAIYVQLGTKVTITEKLPSILYGEDEEITKFLAASLVKLGVTIKTGEELKSIPAEFEKILLSVGRRPEFGELGIDKIGITTENNKIKVNSKMETNIKDIYAIGDVVGGKLLAYKASAEALVAAENCVANKNLEMDYNIIPNCIFTKPEIASVGLNEAAAKKAGYDIKTGKFPFMASGKALIAGDTRGFVKMVADSKTKKILGVQIVGLEATELIAQASILLKFNAKTDDLERAMFAHPTLSESLYCAAEAVEGKAIDLPK